jgi:cell division protein FtsL
MATMAMAGQEISEMQARPSQRRSMGVAERNRTMYEQQRARRRGPTPEMRSFTIVMTMFFALTMVYVWQHFSAIEVGYKVEAQKTQVEQMREQNRQLQLSEAQLSDPGRIDHIAKQLGLDEPMPGQVVRQDGAEGGSVMAQAQVPAAVLSVN